MYADHGRERQPFAFQAARPRMCATDVRMDHFEHASGGLSQLDLALSQLLCVPLRDLGILLALRHGDAQERANDLHLHEKRIDVYQT